MKLQEYLSQNRSRFLDELKAWIAIPSISALPAHKPDMQRAADHLAGMLKRAGIDRVEVRPSDFNPVVYGEHLRAPGQPTILIYGHYDVMPVDPIAEWTSKPFEAEVRGDFLYGRGSADDKGQIAILTNAVEALLKTGTPPCNFKFIFEGGEEVGSQGLDKYLEQHQQELACDAVLVSDTGMAGIGKPSVCVGLRGLCYVEVFLNGPATDLHSGSFGGIVENPAIALAHLIAQLKDKSGKVLIPGFYDDVRALTPADREAIKAAAKTDADLLKSTGAPKLCGEPGYTPTERIWARPTLDVNGIYGGFTGEGAKTVIPAQAGGRPESGQDRRAVRQLRAQDRTRHGQGAGVAAARRVPVPGAHRRAGHRRRQASPEGGVWQRAVARARGRLDPDRGDAGAGAQGRRGADGLWLSRRAQPRAQRAPAAVAL